MFQSIGKYVGNKAKGRISKRVFQGIETCQIFRKNEHFLYPPPPLGKRHRNISRKTNKSFDQYKHAGFVRKTVVCWSDFPKFTGNAPILQQQ